MAIRTPTPVGLQPQKATYTQAWGTRGFGPESAMALVLADENRSNFDSFGLGDWTQAMYVDSVH